MHSIANLRRELREPLGCIARCVLAARQLAHPLKALADLLAVSLAELVHPAAFRFGTPAVDSRLHVSLLGFAQFRPDRLLEIGQGPHHSSSTTIIAFSLRWAAATFIVRMHRSTIGSTSAGAFFVGVVGSTSGLIAPEVLASGAVACCAFRAVPPITCSPAKALLEGTHVSNDSLALLRGEADLRRRISCHESAEDLLEDLRRDRLAAHLGGFASIRSKARLHAGQSLVVHLWSRQHRPIRSIRALIRSLTILADGHARDHGEADAGDACWTCRRALGHGVLPSWRRSVDSVRCAAELEAGPARTLRHCPHNVQSPGRLQGRLIP